MEGVENGPLQGREVTTIYGRKRRVHAHRRFWKPLSRRGPPMFHGKDEVPSSNLGVGSQGFQKPHTRHWRIMANRPRDHIRQSSNEVTCGRSTCLGRDAHVLAPNDEVRKRSPASNVRSLH